ncbi:xyloglucan endotransglucosylase/hydrolase protein 3-like [Impatiens glandulifera]|uniref:xyloglucan endotransglucosylase/hydrolase protein 3-like n=1 Tax=Impatiens glandulifera TaxID=253017 RepID=UPI001FB08B73|nr:xyloglucan endotransglucosylase/hydrolase protein 3-like [Impatiens glandulifera]
MSTNSIPVRDIVILLSLWVTIVISDNFNVNFEPGWGSNHLTVLDQGNTVELLMDQSSGAGFRSKHEYYNGVFRMRMKLPQYKTGGIIISFYLISKQGTGNHDELDFEFIGISGLLQTNIFTNDGGHREEKIKLWFDPTQEFHTYEIDLNWNRILFIVDGRQIREFKNSGGNYITKPLHVEASIWNAAWAGNVDWSKGPYKTYYQDFYIQGTIANSGNIQMDSNSSNIHNNSKDSNNSKGIIH